MFNDSTVNNPVNIDNGERYGFAGGLDTKPRTLMSATRREAGDYPLAFSDLAVDCKVKIGVSLSHTKNV